MHLCTKFHQNWRIFRLDGYFTIFKIADLSHLEFQGSNNGFFERPCRTSYRSSLNCLVFEKIVFLSTHFGDRQTNERTDVQLWCVKGALIKKYKNALFQNVLLLHTGIINLVLYFGETCRQFLFFSRKLRYIVLIVIAIPTVEHNVTLMHPTQTVKLFCNIFEPHCSLANWLGCEINSAKMFANIFPGRCYVQGSTKKFWFSSYIPLSCNQYMATVTMEDK